ncbi:MAG: lipoyl(octanoyl) transferase LipB [Pseudomonadales bacterium]|nr:lipoyl(octanoyl) transferase LipB [Pseudomonadales bacterium]
MTESCRIRRFGIEDYEPLWQAMKDFTHARTADTPDELWVLQHSPVFTLGQAGKAEHVLNPGRIPVLRIDRGGQVTYHGPGQLVVYILVDVKRRQFGVRHLVDAIEQSVIAVLADYGITALTRPRAPGVYVSDAKIAALGLRIRNGRSYHGLSFNIDMDLSPFSRINPCGYAGLQATQLGDLVAADERKNLFVEAQEAVIRELLKHLQYNTELRQKRVNEQR